jgi:hypothetical protein
MRATRKYLPLTRFLETLPPDQPSATLTFAQIEELLGARLPASAWHSHYWLRSSVSRDNWEACGFSARLVRGERMVEFRRHDHDAQQVPSRGRYAG